MPADAQVTTFIRDNFRSIWALELLLFLKINRADPWTSERLVQSLRASKSIVSNALDALVTSGLIICDDRGAASFAPATADLERLVDRTQELYALKPDAVRRLIIGSTGSGLSAFSDSFKLWRD